MSACLISSNRKDSAKTIMCSEGHFQEQAAPATTLLGDLATAHRRPQPAISCNQRTFVLKQPACTSSFLLSVALALASLDMHHNPCHL
jgi:hypothetical protein